MKGKRRGTALIAIIGAIILLIILVLGTIWMGQNAKKDTEDAVRAVSSLYLDELAGRREQVVEGNLNDTKKDMRTVLGMLSEEDLSDVEHLQEYQKRMKQLFNLERFAFVNSKGTVYTSSGQEDNVAQYD